VLAAATTLHAVAAHSRPCSGLADQRRRQPAAQQHDALSAAQLVHRAPGHFPLAKLRSDRWPTLCR
jgi:hypothetical protein